MVNAVGKAIIRKEWSLAERLCLHTKEMPLDDAYIINIIQVYYCHALKNNRKRDEMSDELKKFCEKQLSPMFMALVCALSDDKNGFYKCLEIWGKVGKPSKESLIGYFDWPTLVDIREDKNYKERVEQAYAAR